MKCYIQDMNDFLKKISSLPPLPDDPILCTIDVVGLYSNIPHEEGLIAIRKGRPPAPGPHVLLTFMQSLQT